jgi:hypothetical protein
VPLDFAAPTDDGPSFLTITDCLKAMPAMEGGARFIYMEASNQARDYQGEIVLAKALAESADYYRRFGNLDLDHITQIGPRVGIPDYALFEIGRPVEVVAQGDRTFVKGAIYAGDGQVAERANQFWESITRLNPPQQWFPSVGGQVIEKGTELDPTTRTTAAVIRKVRWTNIGFSKTPVNLTVPSVATVPLPIFAKSWTAAHGLVLKSEGLSIGTPTTDSAAMVGGQALTGQSLDRKVQSYWDFRDRMARDVRRKQVHPVLTEMVRHAADRFGLSQAESAEWTERFLADLSAGATRKRTH